MSHVMMGYVVARNKKRIIMPPETSSLAKTSGVGVGSRESVFETTRAKSKAVAAGYSRPQPFSIDFGAV
jgi:hypothetical protein